VAWINIELDGVTDQDAGFIDINPITKSECCSEIKSQQQQ
jgi:hypothetical protein